MNTEIKKLLNEEIEDQIAELSDVDLGSEQYQASVDGIVKLMDRAIEIEKIESDLMEKELVRENELSLKLREMADERKDRLVKNCLTGASIITGVGLTVWGTLKSLKFEEDGTVTTTIGRGFINKLLPKK